MASRFLVSLCVNSHRNGEFRGLLSAISFGSLLTLEPRFCDRSLRARVNGKWLTLGNDRRSWPMLRYLPWHGNWCWDGVELTCDDAADLLNFVLAYGYRPNEGIVDLWVKIDAGAIITGADLAANAEDDE